MGFPQKVVTSLNEDGSEFTIEVHEPLNPFVAAALLDAPVVKSEVYADEGGMLYVTVSFGGAGVPAKVAELSKDDTIDEKGQPKPEDAKGAKGEKGKTPKEKLAAVFAEAKKKHDDKVAADKAKADADAAKKAGKPVLAAAAPASTPAAKPKDEEEEEDKEPARTGPRPGQPLRR